MYKEFKANETPGDNLKFYRTRDNLTQAQLAEKLGTTRQDVSGMERNCRSISKKTAKELASLSKLLLQGLSNKGFSDKI